MSRCDVDLDRTMPNVELIRVIFAYYNMFKIRADFKFFELSCTHTHTHTHTHTSTLFNCG